MRTYRNNIFLLSLGAIHKLHEQDFGLFLHPPPPLWTDMNILKTPLKNYMNIRWPPLFSILPYYIFSPFLKSANKIFLKVIFKVWIPLFVFGLEHILFATFHKIWKITLEKATWTFVKPPPPSLWTNMNIFETPPSPNPVHVVCERPHTLHSNIEIQISQRLHKFVLWIPKIQISKFLGTYTFIIFDMYYGFLCFRSL